MRSILFSVLLIGILHATDWQTFYEKSGFKATPDYQATVAFCKKLADASPWVHYQSFGLSAQNRDLPLLIVDLDGLKSPEQIQKSGKLLILVQAGIHAGEIDGKDAGLMLIRDLVIKQKYVSLFDGITLLFIPIFNVDGHERSSPYNRINQNGPQTMGWRTTAQNLNLNRDYLKADSPEMQAWLKLFNSWLPDFFVDCHVTDGADYQYTLTYNLLSNGQLYQPLDTLLAKKMIPLLKERMAQKKFPIIDYVFFRKHHDPKSGMVTWSPPPRFSHGYTDIQNRPGLLIETHMLKNYQQRVSATYQMLISVLEALQKHKKEFKRLVKEAGAFTASSAFLKQPLAVDFKLSSDSVMIDFLGYDYTVEKSDLSGGLWYRYNPSKPKTYRIPFFNKVIPKTKVHLPLAYLIPAEWKSVIERLKLHGIEYRVLKHDYVLDLPTYRFRKVSFPAFPYEGRQMPRFEADSITFLRLFARGSALVPMNQRTAKVIAHILEPQAPDSYVHWGFFNTIFEQKEYAESYVMEKVAREMLKISHDLNYDFNQKLKTDSAFAHNPRAILQWFYEHSPYWDRYKDIYPVGRIFDRKLLEKLLKEN